MAPARRAVLAAINQTGTGQELRGCYHDVEMLQVLITSKYGFEMENCTVLADVEANVSGAKEYLSATRAKIMRSFTQLVRGAAFGDSLFFSFSGRGSATWDDSAGEGNGWDGALVPLDEGARKHIVDDEVYYIVTRFKGGVKVTTLFDYCMSGSILDLRFEQNARSDGVHMDDSWNCNRKPSLADLATGMAVSYGNGDYRNMTSSAKLFVSRKRPSRQTPKPTPGLLLCFLGCQDLRLGRVNPQRAGSGLTQVFCDLFSNG